MLTWIFADQLAAILAMIESTLEKYQETEEEKEVYGKERILCSLSSTGDIDGIKESLRSAVVELRGRVETTSRPNMTDKALRYIVADIKGAQGEECELLYPKHSNFESTNFI